VITLQAKLLALLHALQQTSGIPTTAVSEMVHETKSEMSQWILPSSKVWNILLT